MIRLGVPQVALSGLQVLLSTSLKHVLCKAVCWGWSRPFGRETWSTGTRLWHIAALCGGPLAPRGWCSAAQARWNKIAQSSGSWRRTQVSAPSILQNIWASNGALSWTMLLSGIFFAWTTHIMGGGSTLWWTKQLLPSCRCLRRNLCPRMQLKSTLCWSALSACKCWIFCIFWILCISCILFIVFFICRLKKDRKTFKDVPLFGIGMLHMLDQYFWNLPFASPKQATVVREKFNIPEEDWQAKHMELEGEHKADGARDQQLWNGWKQWLGAAGPQAAEPARVAPASLAAPVYDDA